MTLLRRQMLTSPFSAAAVRPPARPLRQVSQWCGAIITEGESLHGAHAWDDQQAFGELMRMGPEGKSMLYPRLRLVPGGQGRVAWAMNGRVRLGVLPVALFANGHTFFVQAAHRRPGAPQPVLVHNTFQFFGESGKRARFRAFGLWLNPGADCHRPRERFLTWNATPPAALACARTARPAADAAAFHRVPSPLWAPPAPRPVRGTLTRRLPATFT